MKRAPVVLGFGGVGGSVEVPSVGRTEPVQREDGDMRPAAKRGKTERYPRAWVLREAEAQRRVQLNPFYQFLELVAGITGGTVHQYYDEEDSRQRASRQAEMAFRRQVVRETYTAEHAARLQIMQRLFGTSQMELFMDGQTAKVRFRESGVAGEGEDGLPEEIVQLRKHFRDKESMEFGRYLESVKAAMNMDVGSQLDMLEEMYMGHSRSWAEMPEHSGKITVNAQVSAAIDMSFSVLKTRANLSAARAEELIYAGVDLKEVVEKLKDPDNPLYEAMSQRHVMARIQIQRRNRVWSIRLWSQMALAIVYETYRKGSVLERLCLFIDVTREIVDYDSADNKCFVVQGAPTLEEARSLSETDKVQALERATDQIEETLTRSSTRLDSILLPSHVDMGKENMTDLESLMTDLRLARSSIPPPLLAKFRAMGLWAPTENILNYVFSSVPHEMYYLFGNMIGDMVTYTTKGAEAWGQEIGGELFLGKDVYSACKDAERRYTDISKGKIVRSYFARMVGVHLMLSHIMSGKRYVPQKRMEELMTQRNNLGVWFCEEEPSMRH
jgi:hypothetical protein